MKHDFSQYATCDMIYYTGTLTDCVDAFRPLATALRCLRQALPTSRECATLFRSMVPNECESSRRQGSAEGLGRGRKVDERRATNIQRGAAMSRSPQSPGSSTYLDHVEPSPGGQFAEAARREGLAKPQIIGAEPSAN
jgi:hypothetical protein